MHVQVQPHDVTQQLHSARVERARTSEARVTSHAVHTSLFSRVLRSLCPLSSSGRSSLRRLARHAYHDHARCAVDLSLCVERGSRRVLGSAPSLPCRLHWRRLYVLVVWTIRVPSWSLTWWRHPSGIFGCHFLRDELFYIRARSSSSCSRMAWRACGRRPKNRPCLLSRNGRRPKNRPSFLCLDGRRPKNRPCSLCLDGRRPKNRPTMLPLVMVLSLVLV